MSLLSLQAETSLLEQAQARIAVLAQTPVAELIPTQRQVIRQGERAIAQLLKSYERFLYKRISLHCPRVDSDAAFSAALVGFRKAIESFDFSSPFFSWLKIKSSSALMDEARRRAIGTQREFELHLQLSNEIGIAEALEFEQLTPKIRAALEKLSELERLCLLLHSEGLSWIEVGEVLGKSPDAARMQKNRAIKKIRIELGLEQAKPRAKATAIPEPVKQDAKPAGFWMRFFAFCAGKTKSVRSSVSGSDSKVTIQINQVNQEQTYDRNEFRVPPDKIEPLGQSTKTNPLGFLRRCWRHVRPSRHDGGVIYHAALFWSRLWPSDSQQTSAPYPETGADGSTGGDRDGVCVGEHDELCASPCAVLQQIVRLIDPGDRSLWGTGLGKRAELDNAGL